MFFNFFNKYIAYYQYEGTQWIRYPILNADFYDWLPILNVTLAVSIVAHIFLLVFDKYILRQTTLIVLSLFGLAVIFTLLTINPFDYSNIPGDIAATIFPLVVTIVLIGISIGLVVGTIVRFIRLVVDAIRGATSY